MTAAEVERLRLTLSTFRDGSGQFLSKLLVFMPDYLDFERATALICGGVTAENKGVFDVAVPVEKGLPFGISCKMSAMQRVGSFMELSNSKKKIDDEFARLGIDWRRQPELAGPALVNLVTSWHEVLKGQFDLASSKYLILAHDAAWSNFELLCFPLDLKLADPAVEVQWCNEGGTELAGPSTVAGYIDHDGSRHRLWQVYPNSGGQVKYYPLREWAEWTAGPFQLEEPPVRSLRDKVDEYFPDQWPED